MVCVSVQRLRYLLRIVLPGLKSKEFGLLLFHSSFLVARTLVSIYVAQLDGKVTQVYGCECVKLV